MRNRAIYFIVDLQFGSTGKGLLAGYLAKRREPDTIVCAFSPNAGHTFVDSDGNKMVVTALPNGYVSPNTRQILIGPGAVINPDKFIEEFHDMMEYMTRHGMFPPRILIHEHAAVVTQEHRDIEAKGTLGIGSTMKGAGEALIDKLRRATGDRSNVAKHALKGTPLGRLVVTIKEYNNALDNANVVQVEGCQGFSLGVNNGFYPYCTSRECTIQQLMTDCAIPFTGWDEFEVYGTARTYPIRVANRYNDKGEQVGYSGPCYEDQRELTWEQVGQPVELTTVTQLPRRIFSFSMEQIRQACRMNGINKIFLNFANYISQNEIQDMVNNIEAETDVHVNWIGYGPSENDVVNLDNVLVVGGINVEIKDEDDGQID